MPPTLQEPVRSFVAIEFPHQVHDLCARIQQDLAPKLHGVSWVKRGNVHLTLKFLGNITSTQRDSILPSLQAAAAAQGPFVIELGGVGVFPDLRRPRVIWLGMSQGKRACVALASFIDASLSKLGFVAERKPVRPHLTLGRIRRSVDASVLQSLETQYEELGLLAIRVEQIVLMQSVLSSKGSIYTPLSHFPL